jgi:glutathione S-transferase
VWSGIEADIDRIADIWRECLDRYGGPFLFGSAPSMADAMFAPVCCRFRTYGIRMDDTVQPYCDQILALPAMQEWIEAAQQEPDAIEELDAEF